MATPHQQADDQAEDVQTGARRAARQLCLGFKHHDDREREAAVESFAAVDRLQFAHLDADEARKAAVGYVDALWAKDAVEESCRENGTLDPDALASADWSRMRAALERRATVAGIDPRYAELTTEAWIEHKIGGDYWTPMMHAQMIELRTALQDSTYPDKPRHGQGGFGPEPTRYVLGNELHDTRQWEQARETMTPYFRRIAEAHGDDLLTAYDAVGASDSLVSDVD